MCYLIAAVFAVTATLKILSFDETLGSIDKSLIVPPSLVPTVGVLVVASEILIVILLLAKRTRRLGLSLALGLSSIFVGYAVWRQKMGVIAPCACFGKLFLMTPIQSGLLALALAVGSAILLNQARPVSAAQL